MRKNNLKKAIKTVKDLAKYTDKYWNDKKKWSRAELLDFIRWEVKENL